MSSRTYKAYALKHTLLRLPGQMPRAEKTVNIGSNGQNMHYPSGRVNIFGNVNCWSVPPIQDLAPGSGYIFPGPIYPVSKNC